MEEHELEKPVLVKARIVPTRRGKEARCPLHGHLLGIFDDADRLIIKCGRSELVIVEDQRRSSPSPGG